MVIMRQKHAFVKNSNVPVWPTRDVGRHPEHPDGREEYGSRVTPVVPPADPTDPQCSLGPLSPPALWSYDESEPAPITVQSMTFSDMPEPLFTETLELSSKARSDRPHDTLPSPPPSVEEVEPSSGSSKILPRFRS